MGSSRTVSAGGTFNSLNVSGQFFATFPSGGIAGDNNYFGFQVTAPGVNGGAPVFGWAQLSLVAGNNAGAQIVQFAYQDDGSEIMAGDTGVSEANVPEPSTNALLLLTLGAAGVMKLLLHNSAYFRA